MKWFDKWFARKCRWAWENRDNMPDVPDVSARPSTRMAGIGLIEEDSAPWQDGLRINIKKVIGGFVVSFRTYDRIKDRSDERHYIITDEQDFNTELGKTITLESMRQ
jgi:hypothetical protein